jgi:hypothetical protein
MRTMTDQDHDYTADSTGIPWPERGDSIFATFGDWHNNAQFDWPTGGDTTGLHRFAEGYRLAAERLVRSIVEDTSRAKYVDALVYPVLFLYHHYMEVRLKQIIQEGYYLLDKDDRFPKHHNILELWEQAKGIACELNKGADRTPLNAVDHVVRELASISPNAEGYRYPFAKNGTRLISGPAHLNLAVLKDAMEKACSFIDAVEMQIGAYIESEEEMMQDHPEERP